MTTSEKISLAQGVVDQYRLLDNAWQPLIRAVNNHDFPAFEESWRCFERYLKAVARLIGDNGEWLNWHIYENKCGARSLMASCTEHGPHLAVNTTDDIVFIIEYKDKS